VSHRLADDAATAGGAIPAAALESWIEHAAHYLPSQGPISVFVHHNTLHAFEDRPFARAVVEARTLYGAEPYLPEETFRRELARGRILPDDLSWALMEDLGDEADRLIGFMGTRFHLRLAMLEHPLRQGTDAELRWLIAETDALRRFREETPPDIRRRLIDQTRRRVMRDHLGDAGAGLRPGREEVEALLTTPEFLARGIERWAESTWEAFTLAFLWRICRSGVRGVRREAGPRRGTIRHRDALQAASGVDTDLMVHEVLIRFTAAFLDQGFAPWSPPGRDGGYLRSFCDLYRDARPIPEWLTPLPAEIKRVEAAGLSPLDCIAESLGLLGVEADEAPEYLRQTLLALRGWAGMIRQMETNAEWAARPAPAGTLVEFLAVRLVLERLALRWSASESFRTEVTLGELRRTLSREGAGPPRESDDRRAYRVFQLAQVRGWGPLDLARLSRDDWSRLVGEIESFGDVERRHVYQLAYERRYKSQALGALIAHRSAPRPADGEAARFQVVCCIDEREESFRRHMEEVEPRCETFGMAGFFGVAMYYRGVAEAQFRPLCPVNLRPKAYVREEPVRSLAGASRWQEAMRRGLGRIGRRLHLGSRTFVGGVLTGLLGAAAALPLAWRILLPRDAARARRAWGRIVTPQLTQLRLERGKEEPGPGEGHVGFRVDEMAEVVEGGLRAIGLTRPERFSPLVLILGHGSSSLNNPQGAAYDCGACGGSRGGPNARAFAQMANDPRVRAALGRRGLTVPERTYFVGGFHNTCDDSIAWHELDRLPVSHEDLFREAAQALDEARLRNAHERCRRFQSAPLTQTLDDAIRHVEARAADLSQTRPELGHATNALCVVGRRERTRGLFLDRRAFLTSYDAGQDDEAGTILAGLLRAVFPVCGGINLEYYFSRVDPSNYGCGTKLPHNIASLLGVMDGPSSDLRTGLPWQMVELHEPIRILIVVETTPDRLARVVEADPMMARLVRNDWVRLAALEPDSPAAHVYRRGGFERYDGPTPALPRAESSLDWYRGWRDHLGFASIVPSKEPRP